MCATCSIAHVREYIEEGYKSLRAFFLCMLYFYLLFPSFFFYLPQNRWNSFIEKMIMKLNHVSPCVALSLPKDPLIVHYKVG